MIIYHTVLFDANVLYPAPMRDVLMQFAAADLFKAKWSADIHRDPVLLVRTRELVDKGEPLLQGHSGNHDLLEQIPLLFEE